MSPERWRRIEELYSAGLQKSVGDRAAFLNASCGQDEALRLEVEGLLVAYECDPAFMETPLMQLAANHLAEAYAATTLAHPVGPYQLRSLIGAGGMGQVYRAWDPRLQREVAVKMLRVGEHAVAGRRDRLVREARTAASLSHPNICTVFEVGESDGNAFIAMELVEGRTLAELIREQPIEPRVAINAAIQCAAALSHAHERGVLHRDLKAGNIVLTPDGSVKVLDFGLARHLDHQGIEIPSRGTAALPANLRGTLAYMAPELLRGELADVRSDIW
jgi:eukaryotic-like serine/threonine-protein kinase